MPQYQNFYPYMTNMGNPYQPNQYQPNTYQQQNYQPMYQQLQTPINNLSGKFVGKPEDITANDVPMNGSYAIFPKNDMSEIYVKSWNANGTINTSVYLPQKSVLNEQTSISPYEAEKPKIDALEAQYNGISEQLKRIEEMLQKPTKKREVVANE